MESDDDYSGTMSSGAFSQHINKNAAYELDRRLQLQYKTNMYPNQKPRDVDDVWRDLVDYTNEPFVEGSKPSDRPTLVVDDLANNNEVPNDVVAVSCPEALKEVLRSYDHANENAFNKTLFDTLRDCLGGPNLIDEHQHPKSTKNKCMDEPIVFTHAKVGNYAIGIVRKVNGQQQQTKNRSHDNRKQLDHCACLLKKDNVNGDWHAVEFLSAVKLKVSGEHNSCDAFEENISGFAAMRAIDATISSTRGSLAQVMLYTMAWVLPSHAKIGQLSTVIPWCVIVGNTKHEDRAAMDRWCRWVSGNIYVPEMCGDTFGYAMTGFGRTQPANNNKRDEAVNDALSVYLETILFGLLAAKTWLVALANRQDCASVATSGQSLVVGEKTLSDLVLRGRAGGLSETDPSHCKDSEWKVSQGEIFTGRLNICQLKEESKLRECSFIVLSDEDKEVDVVVKVSSMVVHKYLTDRSDAWTAFLRVRHTLQMAHYAEQERLYAEQVAKLIRSFAELEGQQLEPETKLANVNRRDIVQTSTKPPETKPRTAPALSDVLFAACITSMGLITIMADLSLQGYTALCPIKCRKDDLPVLWKAFLMLLEKVLIPLADLKVIHPYLRPGYDETANILYKMEGKGKDKSADMKLIDYESMFEIQPYTCPGYQHAGTSLWWQCAAIAYSWKHEKSQKAMAMVDLEEVVNQRPDWLKGFFSNGDKREMTVDLIPHLDDLFTQPPIVVDSTEASAKSCR